MHTLRTLSGGGRRRLALAAAGLALLIAAVAVILVGLDAQKSAPGPPASAAVESQTQTPAPAGPGGGSGAASAAGAGSEGGPATLPASGRTLPAADPTRLDIPAIDVHHSLIRLGQNADGSLQVPSLDDVSVPGWDEHSPTPGQQGPAVFVGHVDSAAQGEGVFFHLGDLRPGDAFTVGRDDGTVAEFTVTGVDEYAKDAFPTLKVYGNTRDAEARLITCGGRFDADTHDYVDNIVAYAKFTGSHPAEQQ